MRFADVDWDSDEERILFVEEASELLDILEEGALQVPPPLDAMFRAAHTLKGSGGMLGLTEWVDTTHRLEDAMDRRGRTNWQWNSATQQLVLNTVDQLRAELGGKPNDTPTESMWQLTWSQQCPMPGVRAFQAWSRINDLIPGTRSDPPESALAEWHGRTSYLWVPHSVDIDTTAIQAALGTLDDLEELQRGDGKTERGSQPVKLEPSTNPPPGQERRDATIRISPDVLESILDGLGDLLLDQAQLEHQWRQTLEPAARVVLDRMHRHSLELQDVALRARMLPLDTLFRQYPRAIHDIARKLDKRINLETAGGNTELDRVVMDRLHEPLLHLLRNACDHGIEDPQTRGALGKPEAGRIRLSAFTAQGHVHIQLADDGSGINFDTLRDKAIRLGWMDPDAATRATEDQLADLLFRPGISTADKVTDISGRGIGLDAVKAFLDEIHGDIHVESRAGEGSQFHIELPMTMAIMTALVVQAGPWTIGVPIATVERIEDLTQSGLTSLLGHDAVPDGESPLPVYSLAAVLDPDVSHHDRYIVRIKDGRARAALAVDAVRGQQEVVIKPVTGLVSLLPWLSGVAMMGDGSLALMVDVRRLVPGSGSDSETAGVDPTDVDTAADYLDLLTFTLDGSQSYGINVYKTREVLLEGAITGVAGQHPWLDGFLPVRGQTVPVISLPRALGMHWPANTPQALLVTEFNQTVQAFTVSHVDRIVRVRWQDIEPLPRILAPQDTRRFTGLVNHPVLGAIELIDFEQILADVGPDQLAELHTEEEERRFPDREVWIADDSPAAQRQVTQALLPLGATLRYFEDGQAVWEAIASGSSPSVCILDVEMPRLDGYKLAALLKSHDLTRNVAVVLHTSLSGHWHADRAARLSLDAVITKFDAGLLRDTVRRLLTEQDNAPVRS